MIDVVAYLTQNGVSLPPSFDVQSLTGVSHDGTVITGVGQSMVPPFDPMGFVIRTSEPVGAPLVSASPKGAPHVHAWPNPTRGATRIALDAPRDLVGRVGIYDAAGRLVRHVLDGPITAGRQETAWDGRDRDGARVAPGVYSVRLESSALRETRKLVVIH